MSSTTPPHWLRDPLLEAGILENGPEISIDPEENPVGTFPEILLPRNSQQQRGSKPAQTRARNIIRCASALFTVGCIAVLCYSAATTVYPGYQATTASSRAIASNHGELRRVTHASGNGTNVMPRDLASCLHRTSFHFQPEKNWMNDPNGPMYYKGYYHFFYQYNPNGAVWGDIVWGHAISTDLIHWLYLDIALLPDHWYDAEGVWSGSVTVREDGVPIILYTGCSNALEQTQNVAIPSDPSDALLRKWHKHTNNPILRHPPGIASDEFRDPTTAWKEDTPTDSADTSTDTSTDTSADAPSRWLMTVGAKKQPRRTGVALLYESSDLVHWKLHANGGILHSVEGTGMWECVDFYPVAVQGGRAGVQRYAGDAVKYVLKASLDDDRHDYYALGDYDALRARFVPDNAARDCGIGLRYDYGKFYASKTFFDPKKDRRVLWGWVNESDSEAADIAKGWSSVQAIPRVVFYDNKTRNNLLQWPVEEVEELRGAEITETDVKLAPGALVEVHGVNGGQLDIEVVFDYPGTTRPTLDHGELVDDDDHFDCHQGGAAHRGLLGPFGLLVLADENLRERTAVFFYVSHTKDGTWRTRFCSDQSRSSLLPDIDTTVYGSFVEVHPSEDFLSLRVLVDQSIVESFVQGGRMVITSRVYPTMAADQAARLFLFNNATTAINVRNVRAWQMQSVPMHPI